MNFLFISGRLSKLLDPNAKIAVKLAEQLISLGHQCTLSGICYEYHEDFVNENGLSFKYLNFMKKSSNAVKLKDELGFLEAFILEHPLSKRIFSVLSFALAHPIKTFNIFCYYESVRTKKDNLETYQKFYRNLFKKEKFDYICVLQGDFELALKFIKAIPNELPMIIYQTDACGTDMLNVDNIDLKIEAEQQFFERAKVIVTTPPLLAQYNSIDRYSSYLSKMISAEFPNIIMCTKLDGVDLCFKFSENYINILYCGAIVDKHRSPKAVLEVMEKLFLINNKIRLYFVGYKDSQSLDDFMLKYPDKIFYHSMITFDETVQLTLRADVLLNISNNVNNMVPSKIFDYFSTGKPIINLQRVKDCAAKSYLQQYNNYFNLEEYSSFNELDELNAFICKSRDNQLPFNKVKSIFCTATPEYVCEKLLNKIGEH